MLVPPQVATEASTATLLRHAVRRGAGRGDVHPRRRGALPAGLARPADGRELANLLLDTAEMPLALLFFGSPPPDLLGADAALTVITMAGTAAAGPEDRAGVLVGRGGAGTADAAHGPPAGGTPLLRRLDGNPQTGRPGRGALHGGLALRAGRSWSGWPATPASGTSPAWWPRRTRRTSSAWTCRTWCRRCSSGRIAEDPEIASEALRLLRVPTDVGYEQTLASLSQVDTSSSSRLGFREFVMRDVDGRVQKVRVDVSYVPDLLTYLDTTPAAATPSAAASDLPSPDFSVEPEA